MLAGLAATLMLVGGVACGDATPESTSAPPPEAGSPAVAHRVPPGPSPSELATKLPADVIRAALPELPLQSAPRPRDYVVAAYEFAALHPEVLKYVPCYCGCERSGHQHNESCFVASRDPDGRVTAWDAHGMG